jgi:hypothetical protein
VSADKDAGLHAFVARGPKTGVLLYPHKHRDGNYVVSMTRFEKDYIKVAKSAELVDWLEKGYGLRMSNKDAGVASPSLVEPRKIYRPVVM